MGGLANEERFRGEDLFFVLGIDGEIVFFFSFLNFFSLSGRQVVRRRQVAVSFTSLFRFGSSVFDSSDD